MRAFCAVCKKETDHNIGVHFDATFLGVAQPDRNGDIFTELAAADLTTQMVVDLTSLCLSPLALPPVGGLAFDVSQEVAKRRQPIRERAQLRIVATKMRRFVLQRIIDDAGVSGTGVVAEGVVFESGKVALAWRTSVSSVAIYDTMDDVTTIHCHHGHSVIVWIDEKDTL